MDASAVSALVLACAPQVHPDTALGLVRVESNFNPWAIGVVGGALVRQPRQREAALATALALRTAGWNFSVGLGQLNVRTLTHMGLTLEAAFEPCINLWGMQAVLLDCYNRAHRNGAWLSGDQGALLNALSCYYSGNFETGWREGYVQKVISAAGLRTLPVARSKEDS